MRAVVTSSGAPLLAVSQFTLHGDTRTGRPTVLVRRRACGGRATRGRGDHRTASARSRGPERSVGAMMAVRSGNVGPFTVLVET
jgi:D-tyrosyl-tRNA(Tyr) deacylase